MRPKKRILLTSDQPCETSRDQLKMLLFTWGFAAVGEREAVANTPDAVIVCCASPEHITAVELQHFPARVVAWVRTLDEGRDALRAGAHYMAISPADLREGLATACARRRGPKPRGVMQQERAA